MKNMTSSTPLATPIVALRDAANCAMTTTIAQHATTSARRATDTSMTAATSNGLPAENAPASIAAEGAATAIVAAATKPMKRETASTGGSPANSISTS